MGIASSSIASAVAQRAHSVAAGEDSFLPAVAAAQHAGLELRCAVAADGDCILVGCCCYTFGSSLHSAGVALLSASAVVSQLSLLHPVDSTFGSTSSRLISSIFCIHRGYFPSSNGPVDPAYLEGYSPERIEAIIGLPEYTNKSWEDAELGNSSEESSKDSEDENFTSASQSLIVRSRVMDVESCDTSLSLEDLRLVRRKLSLPTCHRFVLPHQGQRIMTPAQRYFTTYIDYFTCGLTIPPKSLFVEVFRSVGLRLSQLTSNALMYFEGFCHHLGELGMSVSLDSSTLCLEFVRYHMSLTFISILEVDVNS
ncbi:hypothetical protein Pfo_015506 [Paulownia fortunei]|nr:hypothetical protein Pfo_015506 [Paulownia fortunei]